MITVRLKITDYDKSSNTCTAILLNGDIIMLDPFVGCAIAMTDDEYENGVGFEIVGNNYVLTEYAVYSEGVVPSEGGMLLIS